MATSFISKDGEHGFWISDGFVQIISWGFLNVITDPKFGSPAWMKGEYKEYLQSCSLGHFVGFSSLALKEYVQTDENRDRYNRLIEGARSFFLGMGESIPAAALNAFQTDGYTRTTWTEPFETSRVLKILDYIQDVVNDRMSIRVDDKIDYRF